MFRLTLVRLWSQIPGEKHLTLPAAGGFASICKAGGEREGWHPGTESKNGKTTGLPLARGECIKTCHEKSAFVKVCEATETVAGPSPQHETDQPELGLLQTLQDLWHCSTQDVAFPVFS